MAWDLYLIQSATRRAEDYAHDSVRRVQRYLVDDEQRERRTISGYCRWCWYRRSGSLAGQAFTAYRCARCNNEEQHSNTGVPMLCKACTDETELCRGCCGDRDGKQRMVLP